MRGLHVTGHCDEPTWLAIVEASYHLGDRLLILTAPNLRGDDVAQLQTSLAHLGFDSGRVDGILGPATNRALEDFQRNCGLFVDGVCGPDSVNALSVLSRQSGTGPGVAALRELENLNMGKRTLADLRIVLGQFGGLSSLTRQLAHGLRHRSATVTSTDEPDPTSQAAASNRFGATVYVGFEAVATPSSRICYYAVPTFESAGGHSLSLHIERLFVERGFGRDVEVCGMRLPVLRETRMPAVLCSLGPVQSIMESTPLIVDAIVDSLEAWVDAPLIAPTEPD